MRALMGHPAARWAGGLLSLAALIWLAIEARARWQAVDGSALTTEVWTTAAAGAVAIGAAYILQALNWRDLVRSFVRDPELRGTPLVRSSMVTQVAKYLPGNVAHLAGRHMQATSLGVPHGALGKALGSEIAILLGGALLVVLAAVGFLPTAFVIEGVSLRPLALAALGGVVLVCLFIGWRGGQVLLLLLARAVGWMTVFAAAFWLLLDAIYPVSIGSALAAAAIGWAVGFATPGSPGGIGTREGAMTLMLSPSVPLEALLPALALFRLVTVGADLVCFAIGRAMGKDD
ncbi:hypothetical protein WJT74_03055 [Sphingomicrobium sp. XHP0239]|uniref:hypothetical protein n=1 Tax=Sphingomicrobium maritimum TaxID=3133972 RepID=UPI0031CC801F